MMAPEHGSLGDCPQTLSSGSTCLPACLPGYELTGRASCSSGGLGVPSCTPSACNVTEAAALLQHVASLGNCPELLESGDFCELECLSRCLPSGNISCELGNLSDFACLTEPCLPGFQADPTRPEECELCPLGSYKQDEGSGPCERCPENSKTNATGRTSSQDCQCPVVFYERRNGLGELLSCLPCPNNSAVIGSGHPSGQRQDCQCLEGFMPVLSDDDSLLHCRPAEPCDVSDLLRNLTGSEEFKLKTGTCDPYAKTSMLPSGKQCSLLCDAGLGAQLGSDIFRAIDLTLACDDGKLVRSPPQGNVWCSQASWDVPPLVFLGLTTLATILGAAAIEVRQTSFERQYAKALRGR